MEDLCCNTQNTQTKTDISSDDALVCYCEKVSVGTMKEAIKNGAKNVKDIVDATGACKSAQHCEELNPNKRCCAVDIMQLIDQMPKA